MIKNILTSILIASILTTSTGSISTNNINYSSRINNINNNLLIDNKIILKAKDEDDIKVFISDNDKLIVDMNYINIEMNKLRNKLEAEVNIAENELEAINRENNRKNNVYYNSMDITEISNISANELYNTLININNGKLAKYAWTFKKCEDLYGINAFFLVGLVAQESGWDTSNRANYQNNLTGYAVYNNQSKGMSFDSKEDSIYETAKLLKDNYLTFGSKYYTGKSIWNINSNYCWYEDGNNPNYSWSDYINQIANKCINYYHNNIKQLDDINIYIDNLEEKKMDMEILLEAKRKELLEEINK